MNKVAILLSTYNSKRYLREQLDSLLAQTYANWELYLHDDQSDDDTCDMINSYALKDPRIHLLKDTERRGSSGSFIWLLEHTEADFYMFCDHDDVWLPNKVEMTLEKMLSQPDVDTTPLIVACDAKVTNAVLDVTNPSFWHHCHTRQRYFSDRYYYLFYNNIPGCTMMLNSTAKQVSLPFRGTAFVHDSWIISSVLWNKGRIETITQPLMLYRLHESNLIGSQQSPSLLQQVANVKKLLLKTRQRHLSAKVFVDMSFLRFLLMKTKYLLLFHCERFLDKIN